MEFKKKHQGKQREVLKEEKKKKEREKNGRECQT